jgi:molybdopterin/thiamine biosynthesis adenylyltransferase
VILQPAFFVPIVGEAAKERSGVGFVHSHPFADGLVSFSHVDDEGELALAAYLRRRSPDVAGVAAVYGRHVRVARRLGTSSYIEIRSVGEIVDVSQTATRLNTELFDRQVLAFGAAGQERIARMRVGIVGVGGTGSIVAEQLAFLGVTDFVLVDRDNLELSNANRVIGATADVIGQPKVEVACQAITKIRPEAVVQKLKNDVLERTATDAVLGCDFLFSCTDSHGSRALLNQIAYQYLIPCIDMGVVIASAQGRISNITGRVQMLAPGLPCLTCGEILDPEAVRLDFLPEDVRRKEPYFVGDSVAHQPAVISINGTVASLAVTMFLGAVAGVPTSARLLFYDGMLGRVRPATYNTMPECVVCSGSRGSLSRGDLWPLPSLPA